MNNAWLEQIVANPELMSMGHGQRATDKNLGMGWMYYALARMYRPVTVVCIGSWRGFVPMMFARGMQDNGQAGTVHFVDPGMVDDHWQSPERVSEWFDHYDVNNITHYKKTTQQFVESNVYRNLHNIDVLFVDGYHSAEQAQYDHEAFVDKLSDNSIVLFHDSMTRNPSRIYGADQVYHYSVCDYIDQLKTQPNIQVMDFPFENGVTLLRHQRISKL